MKRLNKNYPKCPLNRKIRSLYYMKQLINNSTLTESQKKEEMKSLDRLINECWRFSYLGKEGYEIYSRD